MDISFDRLSKDMLWTQTSAKGIEVPFSYNMDMTVQLDRNIIISGGTARYNAMNNLLARFMQDLSPKDLRLSMATADADEFNAYADSPYVDILTVAKPDIETMRVIKRISGIVQFRYTHRNTTNTTTVLVLDKPGRLLTKVNKSALTELYGIMAIGPQVGVCTILLSETAAIPAALVDTTCVRISTAYDGQTGKRGSDPFNLQDGQVFVNKHGLAQAATGVIPVVSSDMIREMTADFTALAAEKGIKEKERILLTDKSEGGEEDA